MIVNSGLGGSNSSTIATGVSVAGSAVTIAASLTPVLSTGLLATLGLTTAAVPIIGPVVAGVVALISVLGIGNGCGQTCTASTQVVNYWEPYLQQNLAAAKEQASQNGGCLTSAELSAALSNFDQIWQNVVSQCGQIPAPGGTQCVNDRKQGSTKIGGGSWFSLYRDPIAALPVCVITQTNSITTDVAASVSAPVDAIASAVGVPSGYVWGVGALLGFFLLKGILD